MLIKQNLDTDGHGYKCISTYTNFFGTRSRKSSVDIHKLSKLECEIMAQSKTYNVLLMFCKNGNCEFDENPIENFKWLSTVLNTGYYCRLQKTKIRYKNSLKNYLNKRSSAETKPADLPNPNPKPNLSIDNIKSQINLTNIIFNDAEAFIKKNDGYKQLRKQIRELEANEDRSN
ncbi:hypothetical protein BpHYR1_011845 [Brachionus plicatilis]|uniref:Uncharacterized protein n=1 Tax=Brachionus plicatilis TaxID=10195 RepID=A0A3M7RDK8_BRAPC|nr:hypothetical protein BpHYR1_011845 [Brachionus plicatilis]